MNERRDSARCTWTCLVRDTRCPAADERCERGPRGFLQIVEQMMLAAFRAMGYYNRYYLTFTISV